METFITNADITILTNESASSNILLTSPHCSYFFNPIRKHNIPLTPTTPHIIPQNDITTTTTEKVIYHDVIPLLPSHTPHKKPYYVIEKEKRHLQKELPIAFQQEITTYLHETVRILLELDIYCPINNHTVHFDIINKIPILVEFKNASIITKWQNKEHFADKMTQQINHLLFI
jgi:hypothetical protein